MVEELRFKISSGLKDIIGKELITNDLIAIFELVKNSYDANAKNVKIVFQNIKDENKKKGSRILIIDDGDGMSFEDLKNKWLFVGFSEKKYFEMGLDSKDEDFRDKIQKKRIFAGAKGVGRFSCDRLGGELNLFTRKGRKGPFHHLYMDWNKFEEDQEKEFQTIKVGYSTVDEIKIEDYDIKDLKIGTILEISSLNDTWDWKKLVKLKRHLQRLINPSQANKIQEFEISLEAEEYLEEDKKRDKNNQDEGKFDVINGVVKNILFEKLDIKTTQITCRIDGRGDKIHTKLTDKGKFIFSLDEENEYPILNNLNIELFFLNTEAKKTFKRIMGLEPVKYGSIFLYKNGFRIFPYGDEGDDWLGLERRKSQGYARFLSTRELMGRVEIYGNQPDFKEVSSRDGGVIKTLAYYQLIDFFVKKALRRLEKYVVEGLDWDAVDGLKTPDEINADSIKLIKEIVGQATKPELSFNEHLIDIAKEKQVEKLPEVLKNIDSLKKYVKAPEEKKYIETQLTAIRRTFEIKNKKVENLEKNVKQVEKENLFLKAITGEDKKDILALQHQIGIATSTINNHLIYLKHNIEKGKSITSEDLVNIIDKISLETQKIASVVRFVTKANFDLMTETIEKDLVSFIKQYVENVYKQYKEIAIDNKNVTVNVSQEKDFEFIYRFKPLEFIIIIDNMINNSIKAGASIIELKINKLNENGIELRFKDDGKGILPENIDKIFNFGFTTTDGSGIGLYHIYQIVKKINGTIDVNRSLEKGAEFIIKVEK